MFGIFKKVKLLKKIKKIVNLFKARMNENEETIKNCELLFNDLKAVIKKANDMAPEVSTEIVELVEEIKNI